MMGGNYKHRDKRWKAAIDREQYRRFRQDMERVKSRR